MYIRLYTYICIIEYVSREFRTMLPSQVEAKKALKQNSCATADIQNLKEALQKQGSGTVAVRILRSLSLHPWYKV